MNDNVLKFRKYYKEHINEVLKSDTESINKKIIKEFNEEYPLERISKLTLDEYIYKGKGANTFCSRLADYYNGNGNKENLVGPSLSSGAPNEKFGIYKQDGHYLNYKNNKKQNTIENPEEYYQELRKQLVEVLTNISKGNQDFNYKKYDHLHGMHNTILKIAFFMKPEMNITFGNQSDLEAICKHFGIEIKENDKAPNLSYRIKAFLDKNIPESKNIYGPNTASVLYNYAEEYIKPPKEIPGENNPIKNNSKPTNQSEYYGKNVIFYGVPGCGKSFQVNQESTKYKEVVRTVFHPDYTYTDFIGQVMPMSHKNKVNYPLIAGPFTKALAKAIDDSNKEVLLIIEEINRGNAAAIFGDIFQLLDRDPKSNYRIDNEFICRYIRENTSKKGMTSFNLPKNLTIIATMNTSDQNVYTLDTAFRRRFEFKRIKNVVENEELKNKIISGLNIKWGDFIEIINHYIVTAENLLLNNEDKRLGAYSITESELEDKNKFADKILFYLWDNIGRYNNDLLFRDGYKLYDEVIDDYLNDKEIFCEKLASLLKEKEMNSNE